jgi:hypothetical protein
MIAEVYRAFRSAGVSEEEAGRAASALVQLRDEPWKRNIEKEIPGIRTEISDLRGGQKLLQWMVGTNIALTVALLLKLIVVP